MIWENWSDFFAMGGYGLYVWGSFVVTFGLMFGEILVLSMRWNGGHQASRKLGPQPAKGTS